MRKNPLVSLIYLFRREIDLENRYSVKPKLEAAIRKFEELLIKNIGFDYQIVSNFRKDAGQIFSEAAWQQMVIDAFSLRAQSLNTDEELHALHSFLQEAKKNDYKLWLKLSHQIPRPHAYIKNLALALDPDYDFSNSPVSNDIKDKDRFFIGRKKNLQKFFQFLKSDSKKGVFLVTGYRGMGKTSFVNKAIRQYSDFLHQQSIHGDREQRTSARDVKVVNVNLAQKDLAEIDILKLIVSHVYNIYSESYPQRSLKWAAYLKSLILVLVLIIAIMLIFHYKDDIISHFNQAVHQPVAGSVKKIDTLPGEKTDSNGFFFTLTILFTGLLFLAFTLLVSWTGIFKRRQSAGLIISKLYRRCYSTNSIERNNQHELNIDKFSANLRGPYEKETYNYPIASSKEIEYELNRFLTIVQARKHIEFIFVFDELDKIESAAITTEYLEDSAADDNYKNAYLQQIRQRKQSVINIIAGLKNFLTTAPARFIFIAGREMFDATLADVADRQSSVSSIFNYVFYIESFLKENLEFDNIRSPMSSCIEHYLTYVIFGSKAAYLMDRSLFELLHDRQRDEIGAVTKELNLLNSRFRNFAGSPAELKYFKARELALKRHQIKIKNGYFKALVMLQNFIVYLTYRSNGSPKKIIKLIQEFIKIEQPAEFDNPGCYLLAGKENDREMPMNPKAFLYFGFDDQYKIGFINHLYRPFLIRYEQSFNKYSDNIILSTTYLFDHLLKFHPFAFSLPNLELTPEVLSTNKTPLLREHILSIIEYLSNNHLRETEIGIFDYKFYSRTQSELIYISKTFETEAAAFNFTLDEGYLIKLHIRNELKNLRELHSKYIQGESASISISHLSGILGDLHFFDQEYDEAIVAYADCIKLVESEKTSIEKFVRSLRFMLKLGLTFEKVKSYDEALSCYADASENSILFYKSRLNQTMEQPVMNNLLQIVNQSFIAMIVLQEKMGINGINLHNMLLSIKNFHQISALFQRENGENKLVQANLYLVCGNVLYFKNNIQELVPEDEETWNSGSSSDIYQGLRVNCRMNYCYSLTFYYLGLLKIAGNPSPKFPDNRNLMFEFFKSGGRKSKSLVEDLLEKDFTRNENKYLAMFFSHIGDVLLSSIRLQDDKGKALWKYHSVAYEDIFDEKRLTAETFEKTLKDSEKDEVSISDVLRCYYYSSLFFNKRGRSVSQSFQLRKILYVLHTLLNDYYLQAPNKNLVYVNLIEKMILKPVLEIAGWTAENTDRYMAFNFQKTPVIPRVTDQPDFEIFINNNISNHPDTREAMSLFLYIRLKSLGYHEDDNRRYRLFISPSNSFSTQYTRILELTLWAKLNLMTYEDLLITKGMTSPKKVPEFESKLYRAASEYLHAQLSCLLMIDIYGTDYAVSHSLKGYIHYRIATFIENFKTHRTKVGIPEINVILSNNTGHNPQGAMEDEIYHYTMAFSHMSKAEQLHQQGHEYRKNMDNLIYLEDDINDNAYHFGAALDRFLLNNDCFKDVKLLSQARIDALKYQNNGSTNISSQFY